ncbi:MAG: hypothetical protein ACR2MG_19650 [Pyrinomonadaceae bacterium]
MKILHWILWLIFIALYAGFQFGFRTGGDGQLYRINDRIAFEVDAGYDQSYGGNGVYIRGYKKTNPLVRFLCGACSVDYDETDMPQANYIKGDWVYSGVPQHATAKTDIVNLRTGETLNVDVAGDSPTVDLQSLPEYHERGLVAGEQYKLKQDYVKANFELLSTYTSRCIWIHIVFGILALFLIYPPLLLYVLQTIASAFDPFDPTNYLNPK